MTASKILYIDLDNTLVDFATGIAAISDDLRREFDGHLDDRPNNGASKFEGEWLKFGADPYPDWAAVTSYLLSDPKGTKSESSATASPR